MSSQNAFSIKREGKTCYISGNLTDSIDVEASKEAYKEVLEVDLKELNSVSWHGLQRFYQMLVRLENNILLSNIPPHVYRILLLLPDFGKKVSVKSLIIEIFENPLSKKRLTIKIEELVEIAKKNGSFAKLNTGEQICGSLHHLCRPKFEDHNLPEKNYVSEWCIKNSDICTFFYEYSCFMRVTLEMCALAQESTALLIEGALQNIYNKVSQLESSAKVILPTFSDTKALTLMSLMPNIREVSKSVVNEITLSSDTFEAVSQTFEAMFLNKDMDDSELFEQMSYFVNFTDQLSPIAKSLEDVGVELGDNVLRYGEVSSLRKLFESFDKNTITEKHIELIRSKLKINPKINLTWNETLKDINTDFKYIQNELGHCIVTLQGFDLIRQVLEHRIDEIKLFKETLEKVKVNEVPWQELKDKIVSKIAEKLVTDQEKYSFAFFFPDSTIKQVEAKLTPGDTFFF